MAWVGVVTNAGRALLDSYAAGGHTLNLTGATVGSGTVDEANLRIQTSVSSEKDSASIISAEEIEGGVKYKVQVGPASTSAYVAHQIGIWAKLDNGANTLLMLAQDAEAGVSVPLASVSPAFAFALFLALSVDNTDDLTVNIDESAYVTVGTMRGAIDELKVLPFVVDVTSGQWSGSGSDWYITVTADNVTEDSILVPNYDNASAAYLKGPVWCVPAEGSFTIHTSAIPSGTVKIMVQMLGVMGEAHYQVLADVYSKSQTYSKDQAVAKADIINNLTNTATDKPGSANMLRKLNSRIVANELLFNTSTDVVSSSSVYLTCSEKLINFKLIIINFSTSSSNSSGSRGQLILPMVNQADGRHFALQCGSTLGYIRLQVPSDSQSNLVVLSTGVFSHLYVTGIYGLFRISDE